MTEILLTKKTYGQVIRNLAHFKERNFDVDRKESPHLAPADYGSSLEQLVESTCKANRERCPPGHALRVLNYLAGKGLLIKYLGGFTFPSDEELPTEEEVVSKIRRFLLNGSVH